MLEYDSKAWIVLAQKIVRRDGERCRAACGCTADLSVHHIVPRRDGGGDEPENLVTLCRLCHDEIEADDALRTLAAIRVYHPVWHATVSWYPTVKPERRTPKAQVKTSKPQSYKRRYPATNLKSWTQPTPKPQTALCPACGVEFVKTERNQAYCVKTCRRDVEHVIWMLDHPYEKHRNEGCYRRLTPDFVDRVVRFAYKRHSGPPVAPGGSNAPSTTPNP